MIGALAGILFIGLFGPVWLVSGLVDVYRWCRAGRMQGLPRARLRQAWWRYRFRPGLGWPLVKVVFGAGVTCGFIGLCYVVYLLSE